MTKWLGREYGVERKVETGSKERFFIAHEGGRVMSRKKPCWGREGITEET